MQMVLSGLSTHMDSFMKVNAIRMAQMAGVGSTRTVVNAPLVGSKIVSWSVTAEFLTKMVQYVNKAGLKTTSLLVPLEKGRSSTSTGTIKSHTS